MNVKGLEFKTEGNMIYVTNGVGHNMFTLTIQPGCLCPACIHTEQSKNSVIKENLPDIARAIKNILNA